MLLLISRLRVCVCVAFCMLWLPLLDVWYCIHIVFVLVYSFPALCMLVIPLFTNSGVCVHSCMCIHVCRYVCIHVYCVCFQCMCAFMLCMWIQ